MLHYPTIKAEQNIPPKKTGKQNTAMSTKLDRK